VRTCDEKGPTADVTEQFRGGGQEAHHSGRACPWIS
jgi:hypothetical protein